VSGQKQRAGRAVVTFGRGWQTLVAVRSLGRRGVEALRVSWEQTKAEFRTGSKREGMRKLFRGLRDYLDVKARYQKARQLLEDHKDNIYDVLSRDDPQAALGVLYPLAVFLRHGKVNLELITGEGGPGSDDGK